MKVPISAEFLQSAITLDTIERSAFATPALTKDFGFMRDIGALATVNLGGAKVMGGVYNGSGPNAAANAEPKTFVGRLELAPFEEMVRVGGGGLYGYKKSADVKGASVEGTRARYGGDVQLKIGPLLIDDRILSSFGVLL